MDLFEELFGIPDEEETPGKRAVRERVAGEDIHLHDIGAISIDDVFTEDDVDLDREIGPGSGTARRTTSSVSFTEMR